MAKITWENRSDNASDGTRAISASIFNETKTSVNSTYDIIKARLGTTSSTANISLNVSGNILISGNIIPNTLGDETTSSFDLGSETAAWKELYVSTASINFVSGDGTITKWTKQDVVDLKAGKSLRKSDNKQIVNENDASTFVRMSTAGKAFHIASDKTLIKLQTSSFELGDPVVPSRIIGSSLSITGSTTISGSTTVSGSFTVTDLLNVLADYNQTGSLSVSGSTTLAGDVNMDGAVNIQDLLTVLAGFNASGSSSNTGSFNNSGSFSNEGTGSFTGSLEVSGSGLVVHGGNKALIVTGSTEISGSTVVSGSFTVTDLLTVLADYGQTGSFAVSGSSSFAGDVNMDGNVNVQDLLTILAGFNASGSSTNTGSFDNSGSFSNEGSASFTGSFDVSGSFNGEGTGSFTGSFDVSGSFNNEGTGSFTGSVEISGSQISTGSFDHQGSTNTLPPPLVVTEEPDTNTLFYGYLFTNGNPSSMQVQAKNYLPNQITHFRFSTSSQATFNSLTPTNQDTFYTALSASASIGRFTDITFTPVVQYPSHSYKFKATSIVDSGSFYQANVSFLNSSSLTGGTAPAQINFSGGGANGRFKFVTLPAETEEPTGGYVVGDLLNVLAGYGATNVPPGSLGDINLDGQVNVSDLLMVLSGYSNPNNVCSDIVYYSNTNNQLIGPNIEICEGNFIIIQENAVLTIT
jgi:hypothetical protein